MLATPFPARSVIRGVAFSLILAGAALSVPASPAADVAGTWDLKIEAREGTGSPVVVFVQDGSRLSGTYRGRLGESPLEGSIQGESIQFSVKLKFRDDTVTVSYTGTVRGSEMSGSVRFGDSGEGKWTARRRQ